MEKERKVKKYSIIALIVALLGLTIAFAAISVTLNINATARVNKSGINVVFEKIVGVSPAKSSGVIASLDDPELKQSGTVLNLGDITLNDPGDYYQYSIYVVNKGKNTAKITGIDMPNATELALGYFEVSFKYENGLDVGADDTIHSGESKKVIIKVSLAQLSDEEYEAMPDDLVLNLNGLTITFEKNENDSSSETPSMTSYAMAPAQVTFSNPSSPSLDTIQNVKHFGSNAPSDVNPNTIEKITFLNSKSAVEAYGTTWDASEAGDESVLATYTDSDGNNKYEIYIGADGKVAAPANSFGLFGVLSELTQIDGLAYFDTSNATDMTAMFAGDSKLTSIDLSNFDTSKVTNMFAMFINCTNLNSLNLSSFNTSSVTNMQSMFEGCSSLKSIDMRNMTINETAETEHMFADIPNNTLITVKDNAVKNKVLEINSSLTNVVVAGS